MSTPEGLCTACSVTQYCAEHAPEPMCDGNGECFRLKAQISALSASLEREKAEKEQALAALRKVPLFGLTDDALGWRCAGCGGVSGIHHDGSNRDEACAPGCYVPIVEAAIDRLSALIRPVEK
jgi:hypothetical protein